MNEPLACQYCNAELASLGGACPRCSQFPLATQERQWRRKLLLFRKYTFIAMAFTLLAAMVTALLNWKDGLAVVLLSGHQLWIYLYYGRRLTSGDRTLPGPVSVSKDSKLDERRDWDTLALVFVALPIVASLLVLGKNVFE